MLSERDARQLCRWRPQVGTTSTDVIRAARSLGFVASAEYTDVNLDDLRGFLRHGLFPIVGVNLAPLGQRGRHAQVVVGVTSQSVAVYDPLYSTTATPERRIPSQTFELAWQMNGRLTIIIER
jgi:ABC-type bacteriocin/lantibiotic exporter with double-glycine peptidase domain